MKLLTIRKIVFAFALVASVSVMPTTASAKPSVHINLPGISIGLGDRHHSYSNRYYYNHNYNNYRYYRSTPRTTTYRSGTRYNTVPTRRIYVPSYQSTICPEPGYSANYYAGHGCRQHYDHYHCD